MFDYDGLFTPYHSNMQGTERVKETLLRKVGYDLIDK